MYSCNGGTIKKEESVARRFAKIVAGANVRAVVNGSVYYTYSLFGNYYKPLTKEIGAYWADFRYAKYKGKRTMVVDKLGRSWKL